MIIMVTGSRDWRDRDTIAHALVVAAGDTPHSECRLMQGCASGADAIARSIAEHLGMEIDDFWPDYNCEAFAEANKKRNLQMVASEPDVVLAFPTSRSRGTWHAVNAAKKADIEVRIFQEVR